MIWDALHTHHYVESTQETLLKCELKDLEILIPLFESTVFEKK